MLSGTPGRQEDHLGRQRRQVVPRPQAEQRQPDAGEDPRSARCRRAPRTNRRRLRHVRGVGRVAGEAQRDIRLDRRRQVARPAVERRPGAVGALLGADPVAGRPCRRRVEDAEELAQQRSSASIVTLVSSSPFHHPSGCWRLSRWSTSPLDRAGDGWRSGSDRRCIDGHQNSLSTTKRARSASSAHAVAANPAPRQRLAGGIEVLAGKRLGGLPGARPRRARWPGHGAGVERPVEQQAPQLAGAAPIVGAQGEDHRERLLAGGAGRCPPACRSRSGSPQMPSMSSTAWKATPRWAP